VRDLFLLRPDVVFLNHGSFGACPRPVFEAYQAWQLELERQPVEFLGRRFAELMRTARQSLAAYVGAAPEDVVFFPNTTTAINVVARSLQLGPGDEVLTTNHEYGAVDRIWRFTCRRQGAGYVVCPLPVPFASAGDIIERLWSAVTPRTRVLSLSHVTANTALILPVAEIVRRAREAGILTVVDGAHAPGQVPLQLEALGADFYVGNCHKWMCAPKGAAFLYARKGAQPLLQPLVVSWGWGPEAEGNWTFIAQDSPLVALHEWQGTRDISAPLSVPAAIDFMRAYDWPRVQAACRGLARDARRRLTELTGLEPLSPDGADWYAQMVSLPLPPCDAPQLKRRLYDDCNIEIPVFDWHGRQLIRVSIQAYNSEQDVACLIDALRKLLR
jgi:isopenicillin-N epimerase